MPGGVDAADPSRPVGDLQSIVSGDLDEQPGSTAGEFGHGLRAFAATDHLDDARIQALAGGGPEGQHSGYGVTGVPDVLEAQHHQGLVRRIGHQPHSRLKHDGERAFASDEHPAQVEPALGQQVLKRIAGDLPAEPPEFSADGSQFGAHQRPQRVGFRRGRRAVSAEVQPCAGACDDVELCHIVRGTSVGKRARTAGVVADHPPHRAAAVGGGIGTEPQAVGQRDLLQGGVHRAGFHDRGAGLDVELQHPVEVAAEVDHHAAADGVAGDGGAGAAWGEGDAAVPADLEGGENLVQVPREDDRRGLHSVQGGIAGVDRA